MADIKSVGVVGSGQMGSGIVQVAAVSGYDVVLRSRHLSTAEACKAMLEKSLGKLVDKGKMEEATAKGALERVTVTEDLHALADSNLVIESIVEDLEIKKEIFNELDAIVGESTILATNTSTLSVTEIAVSTHNPHRVVGIHFFNPAPMMSLVEVVEALTTDDGVTEAAIAFADSCGKNPVRVKDRAGFIVNALLFPYLNMAVRHLELGIASRDDIDVAMKGGCNFPMGPLSLLDLVGLDTSVAILDALYEEYGDPSMRTQPLLKRMLAAGHLGRKSGEGFYDYSK